MTFFQWRRFNFFDVSRDIDKSNLANVLQENESTQTAVISGRGYVICGDSRGNIHVINRQFSVQSFRIFEGPVQLLSHIRQTGLLAAIGKDEEYLIKIFDLDKPDKTGSPSLLRTSRLIAKGLGSCVPTAIALSEGLNLISVGFSNGAVLLFRGDITKDRGSKTKLIIEPLQVSSVSGLAFKMASRTSFLYVATTEKVFLIDVSIRDKEIRTELDNLGCSKGLALSVDGLLEAHFVMARNDAVYFYTNDGRGQCYAIEGEKSAIAWFRNYLVVVTQDSSQTRSVESDDKTKHILSIFDLQNKFIAYTAPVRTVTALVSEWGMLYTLGQDNKMSQLTEKDIQSKLDLLFKKNFYDVAIKIAKSQQYDTDGLVDIFRQYGDHLYTKGDLSGAIDNYIKTIGHLEPSYVIRRFLDAFRIHNLTAYLQALHKEGLANEDHTILLLNCYTKLKDNQKLDEFIFKDSLDFDVEIAIKVCRQAAYFQHAQSLARKHNMHSLYLDIELDDLKNYRKALDYIATIDFVSAEANMKKYGSVLMRHLPERTTDFLKVLCTEYRPQEAALVDEAGNAVPAQAARPEDFLHLFVSNSQCAVEFLESMTKSRPRETSDILYNTLLEHLFHLYQYHQSNVDDADVKALEEKIMSILTDPRASFDPDHALILSQMHGFGRGTLYLYERKGLHDQILKHHVESGHIVEALATCRRFGSQNPNLWVQALQWIAEQGDTTKPEDISEILGMIEKYHLMSPLLVVRTLANSPNATLGLVREFLLNVLRAEDRQMKEDEIIIEQYRVDTEKVRRKIDELKSGAVTFQVSQCAACSHPLELPTVHFLCKHSYHQHCFESFSEADSECPTCYPENKKILDIISSQQQGRDQHDTFHGQLEKAEDGFSVVADYFGRGLFRPQIDLATLRNVGELQSTAPNQRISPSLARSAEQSIVTGIEETRQQSSTSKMSFEAELLKPTSAAARSSPLPSRSKTLQAAPSVKQRSASPAASSFPKAPSSVKPSAVVESLNPFDDDDSAKNPFGEPDDDYDEDLNPFS